MCASVTTQTIISTARLAIMCRNVSNTMHTQWQSIGLARNALPCFDMPVVDHIRCVGVELHPVEGGEGKRGAGQAGAGPGGQVRGGGRHRGGDPLRRVRHVLVATCTE